MQMTHAFLAFILGVNPLTGAIAQAAEAVPGPAASVIAEPDTRDSRSGPLQMLRQLFGGASVQPALLMPDDAFKLDVTVVDAQTVAAQFTPAPGYYLYRERISIRVLEPASVSIAGIAFPTSKTKADPTFGDVEVYTVGFSAQITLARSDQRALRTRLQLTYQGCSERGVCYPPIDKVIDLSLPAVNAASVGHKSSMSPPAGSALPSQRNTLTGQGGWFDGTRSVTLLESGHPGWIVAGFFLFGLLLALTPCVWPMYPILMGIIAGQDARLDKTRAFWLSATYVLGMALTYAAIGVVAGLTGSLLSTVLQTPLAMTAMATLFVALALSMFGLYELQMPTSLQSRLSPIAGSTSRRAAGVAAMGSLSALIVGPCIAAPLAAALLYIGQTQDVILGGVALFAMAMGKGVPLLAAGTSLGSWLPRAGPWMGSIKRFLGMFLLAGALWMIAPLLPMSILMASTGLLLAISATLLLFNRVPARKLRWQDRIGKGIGTVVLAAGTIYIVGAFAGSRQFLAPWAGLQGESNSQAVAALPFERIDNLADLEARLAQTTADRRIVMLDFYADWCVTCKEMEYRTFSDQDVRLRLEGVVLLQADVTANSAQHKALLARFGLFGPPGILFFDRTGREMTELRLIGFPMCHGLSTCWIRCGDKILWTVARCI